MCLSTVYSGSNADSNALIIEDVTSITVEDNTIRLNDIAGETKVVNGAIRSIDFVKNTIFIDPV